MFAGIKLYGLSKIVGGLRKFHVELILDADVKSTVSKRGRELLWDEAFHLFVYSQISLREVNDILVSDGHDSSVLEIRVYASHTFRSDTLVGTVKENVKSLLSQGGMKVFTSALRDFDTRSVRCNTQALQ